MASTGMRITTTATVSAPMPQQSSHALRIASATQVSRWGSRATTSTARRRIATIAATSRTRAEKPGGSSIRTLGSDGLLWGPRGADNAGKGQNRPFHILGA